MPCDDPDDSWLDPYDDLLVFSPPKLEVLVNVCHEIVDQTQCVRLGLGPKVPLLAFFDVMLMKIAAAVRIQQYWRLWAW